MAVPVTDSAIVRSSAYVEPVPVVTVTVAVPPFSPIVAGCTANVGSGASSLSVIVSAAASGTPISGLSVAPVTDSASSTSSIRSSTGVSGKLAEALASPAGMVIVNAATSAKSMPDSAPASPVPPPTVTVTATADSRAPESSVAVTPISVAPASSATEAASSDRDRVSAASSSSRIVSASGAGARIPVVAAGSTVSVS